MTENGKRLRRPAENAPWHGLNAAGICSYVYTLLASRLLLAHPVFGGALYLSAQVGWRGFSLLFGRDPIRIPRVNRGWRIGLLAAMLALVLVLLTTFPVSGWDNRVWLLVILTVCMLLREKMCRRILRWRRERGRASLRSALLFAGVHAVTGLGALWALLYRYGDQNAWLLLAGYAVCALLEAALQLRGEAAPPEAEEEAVPEMLRSLRQTNAYKVYETLTVALVIAIQTVTVLLYTAGSVTVTAETILVTLGLLAGVSLLARFAVEWALSRRTRRMGRSPDSIMVMLVGLFLLIYGVLILRRAIGDTAVFYLCLAVISSGTALCTVSMSRMESGMEKLALYAGTVDLKTYRAMRSVELDSAAMAGQVLALLLLLAHSSHSSLGTSFDVAAFFAGFQPLLLLPPLLLLLAALLMALRYPLSDRVQQKIERILRLQKDDSSYPALKDQLDSRVIRRRSQAYGIRILRWIVRRVYPLKTTGVEHIRPDDDNPLIFLCNHGEILGPVAAICSIPVPVRAWTIDRMMDEEIGRDYMYRYTFSEMKVIPRPLRRTAANLAAKLSVWCMRSLDSIPVYRDKPTQLMKTFRLSAEALQSGDNLVIFPENPNAVSYEHGYEREGVGELFSGFAMLAAIYHHRTGKRCRFMPMYAHRGMRTVAFGQEIVYDPDADPADERERISREAWEQMNALYLELDRAYRAREKSSPPQRR